MNMSWPQWSKVPVQIWNNKIICDYADQLLNISQFNLLNYISWQIYIAGTCIKVGICTKINKISVFFGSIIEEYFDIMIFFWLPCIAYLIQNIAIYIVHKSQKYQIISRWLLCQKQPAIHILSFMCDTNMRLKNVSDVSKISTVPSH